MEYVTIAWLIDECDEFNFAGQTKADKDGNYETAWKIPCGPYEYRIVMVKQNLFTDTIGQQVCFGMSSNRCEADNLK